MEAHPVKLLFKDRSEFRALHNGQDCSFLVIGGLYAAILAGLAAVRAFGMQAYPASLIIIGWAQYSLGNGLHEAVHHNLRNRRSDFWASLLTAYPLGLTMAYRSAHLRHHEFVGTTPDPDFSLYNHFPKSKLAMLGRFIWFASGIPAILQFFQQQASSVRADKRSYAEPASFLLVQAAVAALFFVTYGNVLLYLVLWALPIATVGKLLSSTRLLCEHGSPNGIWVVRTISGPRWQTWIMGAFDFNYHGEHHLFPSVPYAGLRRLYERHISYARSHPEYQPFDGHFEFYDGGYLNLLAEWFRRLPLSSRRP